MSRPAKLFYARAVLLLAHADFGQFIGLFLINYMSMNAGYPAPFYSLFVDIHF